WVSVFNLCVVTLFWSVMADLFSTEQGQHWFGSMAAAGSVGSLCGSGVAWLVTEHFGIRELLIVSAVALELGITVAWWVDAWIPKPNHVARPGIGVPMQAARNSGTGGDVWSGITSVLESPYLLGICGFVALGKFVATFIYNFLQIGLKAEMPDVADRTQLFSQMNFWSQGGSLLAQGLVAAWLLRWVGIGWTLAIPGLVLMGLFVVIQGQPTLTVMAVTQVTQQILGYGLLVPAQHVLFTVVSRDQKYKSKAFIDNVVFRGSDAASAVACDTLAAWTSSLARAAAVVLPLVAAWTALGWWLGRWHTARRDAPDQGQSPGLPADSGK
ncbi:MAG TPA: hypothetical protein VIY86_07465, partial [Pirellulaceae bacterium]